MILILTLKSASALDVNNFQKSYLSLQLIGLADGLGGFRACQSDDSPNSFGDGLLGSDHEVAHVAWKRQKKLI